MRSAAAALALGLTLTAAAVASCAGPGGPGVMPAPEPSVTPVYASEEEALAAAEELYGRYYGITNELGHGGWSDTSKIEDVVAGDALQQELETAASLSAKGYRQIGHSTFDSLRLQQVTDLGQGSVDITIYACGDVSSVDVVDVHGNSVVSSSRPDRQPVEVEMADNSGTLKIIRREPWSGDNFC